MLPNISIFLGMNMGFVSFTPVLVVFANLVGCGLMVTLAAVVLCILGLGIGGVGDGGLRWLRTMVIGI